MEKKRGARIGGQRPQESQTGIKFGRDRSLSGRRLKDYCSLKRPIFMCLNFGGQIGEEQIADWRRDALETWRRSSKPLALRDAVGSWPEFGGK